MHMLLPMNKQVGDICLFFHSLSQPNTFFELKKQVQLFCHFYLRTFAINNDFKKVCTLYLTFQILVSLAALVNISFLQKKNNGSCCVINLIQKNTNKSPFFSMVNCIITITSFSNFFFIHLRYKTAYSRWPQEENGESIPHDGNSSDKGGKDLFVDESNLYKHGAWLTRYT